MKPKIEVPATNHLHGSRPAPVIALHPVIALQLHLTTTVHNRLMRRWSRAVEAFAPQDTTPGNHEDTLQREIRR
jgi:hypothetical protein